MIFFLAPFGWSRKTFAMRVQVYYLVAIVCFASNPVAAVTFGGAEKTCFDFTRPVRNPLKFATSVRLVIPGGEKITESSGEISNGANWAAVRGDVERPLLSVLKELETHEVTKGARTSVKIADLTQPGDPRFLALQSVRFHISPFPLINVDWIENWAFSLLRRESRDLTEVLVAYEKVQGTSYIRHLCGNYLLEGIGSGRTDVFLYEEAQATHRSRKDTLDGVRTTLQKLREHGSLRLETGEKHD